MINNEQKLINIQSIDDILTSVFVIELLTFKQHCVPFSERLN